jgi:hypothetical protein
MERVTARVRRLGALALALALAAGCASSRRPIEYESDGEQPDTADGLYRVRASRVGAAFLKPGADFSAYDGVLIDPVTVAYKREPRPATGMNRGRGNFALDDAAMERLKQIFQESFERALARSQYFAVVEEAGPRVLRVSGHIVDLVVDVPPERGGEFNFVLQAGEMTLILNVHDSQTGAPLARVADRRAIRPRGASITGPYKSTAVNNWGAVREIFSDWARILRDGLDQLRFLTEVPPPGATTRRDGEG